jgi:NADH dehydrogenase FAD-containing subunit
MAKEFRSFDPASARVILVEAGPRVLAAFPDSLSGEARAALTRLGVEVRTGQPVKAIAADHVVLGDERLETRTVVWAAGVTASPAAKWLGVEADRAGRVKVGPDLSVPGKPDIFVIGDTAAVTDVFGQAVPGLAPAAKQEGAYVARLIGRRIEGRRDPAAFRYLHLGSLATIGRKAAVADFGFVRLTGTLAWWFWGMVHVAFLVGARNRLAVLLDWMWSYLTFGRGVRLITGGRD